MQYRSILYGNYYTTQAGKQTIDVRQNVTAHHRQLAADFRGLLPNRLDATFLDLGCGFGSFLLLLQQQGYRHLKGIDMSREQVEIAHKNGLKEVVCGNIFEFLQNDIQTYDCITAIDVIEHFTKDELVQFLQLVLPRLSTDGVLIMRTCNADALLPSPYTYGDFTHETLLNKGSAEQLLNAVGFGQAVVYPSVIVSASIWKTAVQRILFAGFWLGARLLLFSTARSAKLIVFTPNIVISARR